MKRTGCVIICLLVAVLSSAKTSFVYDVGFEMNFDNREFYKSAFSRSMTIFGARLTPEVGLKFVPGTDMSHRLMVGADMMKDFGTSLHNEYIDVKIGAMFHFHDFRYSGCQQVVKLCFNLCGLIGRNTDKI